MIRIFNSLYATLIYGVGIVLTLLFVSKADKCKRKNSFLVYSILAVLIPSILAGLRDLSVGTDVRVYAYPAHLQALRYEDIFSYITSSNLEMGYSILVYTGSHILGSIQGVLFLTSLFQILPVYMSSVQMRHKVPMVWTMLVYLCLFYVCGFNIMRQCIAVGWTLLAFIYIYSKHYIKGLVTATVAFLFHSTAIVGVLFIVLALINKFIKKRSLLIFFSAVFFLIFVSLMQNWSTILLFLGKLGFLSYEKIVGYSDVFSGGDTSHYMYTFTIAQYAETAFKLLFLLICLHYTNKSEDQMYNTILGIYLVAVLMYIYFMVAMHTSYGFRISLYAEYFLILILPLAVKRMNNRGFKKLKRGVVSVRQVTVWGAVVMNWLVLYCLLGTHGTYPFKFFFQ